MQGFTEDEYNLVVDLFNFIANNAEFNNMSLAEASKLTGMYVRVSKEILPKIESHILEVGEPKQLDKSKSQKKEDK